MTGRRWVGKTLLLLFGGSGGIGLPLIGGAMPPDTGWPRRWDWRGRGRVRLSVGHAVAFRPFVAPAVAEMPAWHARYRSVRHLLPREGGLSGRRTAVRLAQRKSSTRAVRSTRPVLETSLSARANSTASTRELPSI